jgi:hypothetical protein
LPAADHPNVTTAPAPQGAISPARLHGEACIICGRADGPLVDAGYVYTQSGKAQLGWPVVACEEHLAQGGPQ